jgi:CheY-like chemotaxis protein
LNIPTEVIVELIRLIPALLWVGLVAVLLVVFSDQIRHHLIPRLTGVKGFGVELTFLKEELARAAENLPAGTVKNQSQVARRAERLLPVIKGARILLVNDNPEEMRYAVDIMRSLNMNIDISRSTDEALQALQRNSYDVMISDMKREGEEAAGQQLLRESLKKGIARPTIFTVGRYDPERGVPPYAFGITNRLDELLNLVFDVLERSRG